MRAVVLYLAATALLGLLVRDAAATPASDFARAREEFQHGNYREAIPLLKDLLYPTARLSSKAQLAEAHLLLGVAHFETDNRKEAAAEFQEALRYDEDMVLDELLFTKESIEFFEEQKAEYKRRAKEEEEKRKLAEERDAYRRALANLRVINVEKHPYYINFIPFGAGQFQNGQSGKAYFFSISQGVTGGASMLIFGYLWLKYGYEGKVPPEDASSVRRWQQIQITSGALCLGLMAWGIVDSLRHYKKEIRRQVEAGEADEYLLPKIETPAPAPAPAPTLPAHEPHSSLHLLPAVVPDGVGLAILGEF